MRIILHGMVSILHLLTNVVRYLTTPRTLKRAYGTPFYAYRTHSAEWYAFTIALNDKPWFSTWHAHRGGITGDACVPRYYCVPYKQGLKVSTCTGTVPYRTCTDDYRYRPTSLNKRNSTDVRYGTVRYRTVRYCKDLGLVYTVRNST